MDSNTKDVLLVCLGSLASLLGSLIALLIQGHRERKLAQIARREKHFEEVRDYLHSISVAYATGIDYLEKVNTKSFVTSPQQFQSQINLALQKTSQSRFNGLPNMAISKDKKIIDMLAEVQDFSSGILRILHQLSNGRTVEDSWLQEEFKKHEKMNMLIAEILDKMEKQIYL